MIAEDHRCVPDRKSVSALDKYAFSIDKVRERVADKAKK